MISKNIKYCLIIFICLINVHCYAENITLEILSAKVIKVVDGDTVYLKHKEYGKLKIRLADIDAPEKDQPHGIDATDTLKKLIDKRSVKLKKITVDRYNRIVGIIYANDVEINYYLVRNGYAWCYDKYNKRAKIKNAENMARLEKLGLWSNQSESPIAPWGWRKNKGKKNE